MMSSYFTILNSSKPSIHIIESKYGRDIDEKTIILYWSYCRFLALPLNKKFNQFCTLIKYLLC